MVNFLKNIKRINSWTVEEVHEKKIDIRRFKHNEVNLEVTCESNQKYLNVYIMNIFKCFG